MSFNRILSIIAISALMLAFYVLIKKFGRIPKETECLSIESREKLELVTQMLTRTIIATLFIFLADFSFVIADCLNGVLSEFQVAWKVTSVASLIPLMMSIIIHLDVESLRRETKVASLRTKP